MKASRSSKFLMLPIDKMEKMPLPEDVENVRAISQTKLGFAKPTKTPPLKRSLSKNNSVIKNSS
jgi:hypothetical protein